MHYFVIGQNYDAAERMSVLIPVWPLEDGPRRDA